MDKKDTNTYAISVRQRLFWVIPYMCALVNLCMLSCVLVYGHFLPITNQFAEILLLYVVCGISTIGSPAQPKATTLQHFDLQKYSTISCFALFPFCFFPFAYSLVVDSLYFSLFLSKLLSLRSFCLSISALSPHLRCEFGFSIYYYRPESKD